MLSSAHSKLNFEPGQAPNNLNVIYEEDQQASYSRLQQPKTLLQDRSLRNGSVRLQKIPGRSPNQGGGSSMGGSMGNVASLSQLSKAGQTGMAEGATQSILTNLKGVKLSNDEQSFL